MLRMFSVIGSAYLLFVLPTTVCAAKDQYPSITLRHHHHLYALDPDEHDLWRRYRDTWFLHGKEVHPPQSLRVDGDSLPLPPQGFQRRLTVEWDTKAIEQTLLSTVSSTFNRQPKKVTITDSREGVSFTGSGMLGRFLDTKETAELLAVSLDNAIYDVHMVVRSLQPDIEIEGSSLRAMGIQEIVAVGESDFSRSPSARRHNIATGLAKFNGHIIPQGETFSFNEVLGPVNEATGYREELVILGDKTLPEFGGGLCQVSTTAYRGVWEAGFPINQRRNHSYSVRYYSPHGTDATIYPPYTDMRFTNDSPGALLMQTYTIVDKAYFVYYGTKDSRTAELIGPYKWDEKEPPPDRVEYTTELPPGETRQVGSPVKGMQAAWFRIVQKDGVEALDPTYSFYQARPLYTQIGQSLGPSKPVDPEEAAAARARRQERLRTLTPSSPPVGNYRQRFSSQKPYSRRSLRRAAGQ